jgi:hypothetical protein
LRDTFPSSIKFAVHGNNRLKLKTIALFALAINCRAANLEEIVTKAAAVLRTDWDADPNYASIERDETRKGAKISSKTSQFLMIEGSDYNMPVATDDKPLSPEQQVSELKKLKREFERRKTEDADSRRRRVEKYQRERDENGTLLLDFPNAFNYELLREEVMNGRPAYVLGATPKERSGPLSRAAKVLSGMKGTIWIEKASFHVIRGECTVFAPVPIFGILAKVLPGTSIELEMAPVSDQVWLITRFGLALNVSKLGFHSSQITNTTYSDYRLNSEVLKELLAKAGVP